MAASTSFRISDAARARLASRAAHEGVTATALLDQLIIEGIDQLDYPGIVFRGPAHDRRAALQPARTSGKSLRACKNWTVAKNSGSASWPLSRICTPGSSASPWITRRNTPVRSANGSIATGPWPSGAATRHGSAKPSWRDRLPDR